MLALRYSLLRVASGRSILVWTWPDEHFGLGIAFRGFGCGDWSEKLSFAVQYYGEKGMQVTIGAIFQQLF
jgi:hypothetical protein